mgnify:FL=1
MKSELPKCPKCGSGKVAYHVYSLFPGEEDVKSIELIGYRVEYRGCWDGDSYVYACAPFNHGWD